MPWLAANHLLIPIQAEYYALEGLEPVDQYGGLVQQGLESRTSTIGGILITMFDPRLNLARQVMEDARESFQGQGL